MTRDQLAAVAESALVAAGPSALVTAWHERTLRAEVTGSRVAAVHSGERAGVDVLAIADGHTARATSASLAPEDVARSAARARSAAAAIAAAAPAPGDHPGPPEPATPRSHDGFDPATARLDDTEATAALLAAFEEQLSGADATLTGVWEATATTYATAATSGQRATDAVTSARARLTARDSATTAERSAVAAAALDVDAVVREALTARDELPATLPPGDYTVVLGPDAVAAVLWLLATTAFDGARHAAGDGLLSGRLGTRVAAPSINLSDTPRFHGTLPRAFDAEGVPKAPIPLIQDGVAHRVVHDLQSAARAGGGARSTGHASAHGPQPRNLVLAGGGATDEHELAEPIALGAYLPRLDALAPLHPTGQRFSAVAGPGARVITDGRIGGPLEPLRVTAGALDVLAHTEALGARLRLVSRVEPSHEGPRLTSSAICPPLRTHGVHLD